MSDEVREVIGKVEKVERKESPEPDGWAALVFTKHGWAVSSFCLMPKDEAIASLEDEDAREVRLVRISPSAPSQSEMERDERDAEMFRKGFKAGETHAVAYAPQGAVPELAIQRLSDHYAGDKPDEYIRGASLEGDWVTVRSWLSSTAAEQGESGLRAAIDKAGGEFLYRRSLEPVLLSYKQGKLSTRKVTEEAMLWAVGKPLDDFEPPDEEPEPSARAEGAGPQDDEAVAYDLLCRERHSSAPAAAREAGAIREALDRLLLEVRACWEMHPIGLRENIGNTNYRVIEERIREAERALGISTSAEGRT